MNTSLLYSIGPAELRQIIREEIDFALSLESRALSPKEMGKLLGKSVSTISRMKAKGELTPVHPFGHPRYSINDILKLKDREELHENYVKNKKNRLR